MIMGSRRWIQLALLLCPIVLVPANRVVSVLERLAALVLLGAWVLPALFYFGPPLLGWSQRAKPRHLFNNYCPQARDSDEGRWTSAFGRLLLCPCLTGPSGPCLRWA